MILIKNVVLETKRLILRRLKQDDLLGLHELTCQKDVTKMCGWKPHKNIEETQELLNNYCDLNKHVIGIVLKENNKLIGLVEYVANETLEIKDKKGMELAFLLSNKYWGNGYMVEALNCFIEYGFNFLSLEYILASHLIDNYQSKRVLEKCGFEYIKNVKYQNTNGEILDTRTSILFHK